MYNAPTQAFQLAVLPHTGWERDLLLHRLFPALTWSGLASARLIPRLHSDELLALHSLDKGIVGGRRTICGHLMSGFIYDEPGHIADRLGLPIGRAIIRVMHISVCLILELARSLPSGIFKTLKRLPP